MKIALFFFSATGNTAKIAEIIEKQLTELNVEVDKIDITSYLDRQKKINLDIYHSIIFGAPVYSRRAPRIVREWLQTLDGKNKKCSMFFTYGGPSAGVAHYYTKQILKKQGFQVISSAEFLGKHSFNYGVWKFCIDRPNSSDFDVAKEYALKTYKRFIGEDSKVVDFEKPNVINEKVLDSFEKYRFIVVSQLPTREDKECSMCRLCEKSCPTGAMNADMGRTDKNKCIICMRCVANCPDNALKINDISSTYTKKLKMEKLTEEILDNRVSKILL